MNIIKNILLIFSIIFCVNSYTQTQYKFKVMAYNTLNLQSSSTDRFPYFKKVIEEAKPDILVLEEVQTNAALNAFKSNVLDATYSCGTYIDGNDSERCLCYKLNKFKFISNTPIYTNLRDINMFTIVHLPTGDTLRVFAVHLKASDTQNDAQSRNTEIQKLRAVTDQFSLNQDWIVCGDFNFYRSTESAYQLLKNPNGSVNGYVIDPINLTGEWGVAQYSQHHTQSPRAEDFGGGVSGGLDDRFDLILYSKSIDLEGGLDYVPNSTVPFGNDGQHYNLSINAAPTNTAVNQTVADALYYASDHLPITTEFVYTVANIDDENNILETKIIPNPNNGFFSLTSTSLFDKIELVDISGKIIVNKELQSSIYDIDLDFNFLEKGIYFINLFNYKNKSSVKLLIE